MQNTCIWSWWFTTDTAATTNEEKKTSKNSMNIIKLESVFEIAISDKFNSIQCSKVKHTHKKRSKLQTPFHFEQKKTFILIWFYIFGASSFNWFAQQLHFKNLNEIHRRGERWRRWRRCNWRAGQKMCLCFALHILVVTKRATLSSQMT